jgi:hypothetical protein
VKKLTLGEKAKLTCTPDFVCVFSKPFFDPFSLLSLTVVLSAFIRHTVLVGSHR